VDGCQQRAAYGARSSDNVKGETTQRKRTTHQHKGKENARQRRDAAWPNETSHQRRAIWARLRVLGKAKKIRSPNRHDDDETPGASNAKMTIPVTKNSQVETPWPHRAKDSKEPGRPDSPGNRRTMQVIVRNQAPTIYQLIDRQDSNADRWGKVWVQVARKRPHGTAGSHPCDREFGSNRHGISESAQETGADPVHVTLEVGMAYRVGGEQEGEPVGYEKRPWEVQAQ